MSFLIDEDFKWFLQQFGSPQNSISAENSTVEKYRNKLPDRLLDYWREYGFCGFSNGLLWLVNPEEYEETMHLWLKGTEVFQLDKFHVIARSGFGVLYLWGEQSGQSWNIEQLDGRIFNNGNDEDKISSGLGDELIKEFFGVIGKENIDLKDVDTRKPIFEKAVKDHNPLLPDEMFTFEPAPLLGGKRSFKSIKKVNFFVQSDILASMGQREIMDIKGLTKKAFGK